MKPAMLATGDLAAAPMVPAYLRSHGTLALGFARRGDATVLRHRQEGGCLRVRSPRAWPGQSPEAVVINTSGGLCGGDSVAQRFDWQAGTEATVTTQAAEKVYGARDHGVTIATRIAVGAGARAEWLPQETILFDGARLRRDTQVDLADGARFLWVEATVFGRVARGETFATGSARDSVRIRRGGRLVYADVLDLSPAPAALLARAALGGGARASALILLTGDDEAARLDTVRARLAEQDAIVAAASAWNGLLAVRLLAHDPFALRCALVAVLGLLRDAPDLPRVWRC